MASLIAERMRLLAAGLSDHGGGEYFSLRSSDRSTIGAPETTQRAVEELLYEESLSHLHPTTATRAVTVCDTCAMVRRQALTAATHVPDASHSSLDGYLQVGGCSQTIRRHLHIAVGSLLLNAFLCESENRESFCWLVVLSVDESSGERTVYLRLPHCLIPLERDNVKAATNRFRHPSSIRSSGSWSSVRLRLRSAAGCWKVYGYMDTFRAQTKQIKASSSESNRLARIALSQGLRDRTQPAAVKPENEDHAPPLRRYSNLHLEVTPEHLVPNQGAAAHRTATATRHQAQGAGARTSKRICEIAAERDGPASMIMGTEVQGKGPGTNNGGLPDASNRPAFRV